VFAPKVPNPQTKATEGSTSRLAPHRPTLVRHRLGHGPVEQALLLQRTVGNQATLRYLSPRLSDLPAKGPAERHEQDAATENMTAREAPRGASSDFSKIPLFAPDRIRRFQTSDQSAALLLTATIQPKLAIGRTDDPLEHEASRVADQVMRMPNPGLSITGAPPQISRKCAACEEEAAPKVEIQRAQAPEAAASEAPSIVHEALHSPGQPLDPVCRAYFEPRFRHDFSRVRVHADAQANASARAIGALAYTAGQDIIFGTSQYAPDTGTGKRLLAHELAHVVQQDGLAATPAVLQRDLATPTPDVAPQPQPDLTDAQIREAILFNSAFYDAVNTRLIQNLLGGPVTGRWTADNIIAIASTQEEYGLKKDGKVGPDTFRFITSEQTLEGAGTDTPNCLTSFVVNSFPVVQNATPGPGGTTQIRGHHVVEARFSDRCNCSEFQYRQFIGGTATASRGGTTQDLSNLFSQIPGGVLPVVTQEDGNTSCPSQNYGHREQPGQTSTTVACGEDHYTNDDGTTNQASGCHLSRGGFPENHGERLANRRYRRFARPIPRRDPA
jgi:hypothetical protein